MYFFTSLALFLLMAVCFSGCAVNRFDVISAQAQLNEDVRRNNRCHCIPAATLKNDSLEVIRVKNEFRKNQIKKALFL